MTVEINYEAEEKLHIPYRKIITKAVEACIEAEKCPYEAEVSVTIVDGPAIRELNRDYRGIDKETDVLSFPMLEFPAPDDFDAACTDDSFNPETGRRPGPFPGGGVRPHQDPGACVPDGPQHAASLRLRPHGRRRAGSHGSASAHYSGRDGLQEMISAALVLYGQKKS